MQEPKAEILRIIFLGEQWNRTTRWEYANGSWTFVDFYRIQVQLLVKHDNVLAIIRPINLKKDHQKGDDLIAIPLDGRNDALICQRYLLLSKIK